VPRGWDPLGRGAQSLARSRPSGRDTIAPVTALQPGLTRVDEFVVEERMLTDVGGSLGVRVLSTPSMISLMERNAARLAAQHLPPGQATVGFEVCVRHVAGAREGARCSVSAELQEVIDGRKLRFAVEVREGERRLGLGTHERRIIDVQRHRDALCGA
jgi:fluoroacetyl-CoA thioesterase